MPASILENPKTFKNHWPSLDSKIAVCMSGGVDSSVSAYILANKGYKTIGLTGWLFKGSNRCCDGGMVDAAKVSEFIGIKHLSKDLRELFKNQIVDHFISSYGSGSTPIPCITCNNVIKWGSLMEYAFNELNCTHIATGHYAKLVDDNGRFKIVRPKDRHKDQTFMLWGLSQEVLSKTVFPLGDLTKDEVRDAARAGNLFLAEKEESQDICFVSDKEGTQGFLGKFLEQKEGFIIENKTGNVLGTHSGTHNYTIGQRKGMGIAYSEPLYVVDVDVEKNIVYAGTKEELEGYELIAKDVNWIECGVPGPRIHMRVMAKIRYNSKTSPATLTILPNNQIKVIFDTPQSAITPGQAVVMYDETDEVLLGGGWIIGNETAIGRIGEAANLPTAMS